MAHLRLRVHESRPKICTFRSYPIILPFAVCIRIILSRIGVDSDSRSAIDLSHERIYFLSRDRPVFLAYIFLEFDYSRNSKVLQS